MNERIVKADADRENFKDFAKTVYHHILEIEKLARDHGYSGLIRISDKMDPECGYLDLSVDGSEWTLSRYGKETPEIRFEYADREKLYGPDMEVQSHETDTWTDKSA